MPIYEYVCMACGQEFEAIQKFSDDPLTECMCGESGQVERKLSLSAFQLKGDGWYKDLYSGGKANGNGSNGNGASNGDKAASDGASTGDSTAKGDSAAKSDSTSSSKSEGSKSDSAKSGGSSSGSTTAAPA